MALVQNQKQPHLYRCDWQQCCTILTRHYSGTVVMQGHQEAKTGNSLLQFINTWVDLRIVIVLFLLECKFSPHFHSHSSPAQTLLLRINIERRIFMSRDCLRVTRRRWRSLTNKTKQKTYGMPITSLVACSRNFPPLCRTQTLNNKTVTRWFHSS